MKHNFSHEKFDTKRILDQLKLLVVIVFFATPSFANPTGGSVASGNITIQQSPNLTQIHQTTQRGIINWQSFNIGSQQTTKFIQPQGGVTLNRINPYQGVSQIFGNLIANGQIILINQAGIFFGPNAHVDVAGLIASTIDITNQNFLAGNYQFNVPSLFNGAIINEGNIVAQNHGLIALLAPGVINNGYIRANLGYVAIAAGNAFTLTFDGTTLISFTVNAPVTQAAVGPDGQTLTDGVKNTGTIVANAGTVLVSADAAEGVLDNSINMGGRVIAHSVSSHNGEVIFSGGDNGIVEVSGSVNVSGRHKGSTGGTVKVTGQDVLLTSTANINANGSAGGGTVLIGGDAHGAGPDPDAQQTIVESGAIINANALTLGNGGQVVIWSDQSTQYAGSIYSQGGALGGNGGWVEVSGGSLGFDGYVNTAAPNGQIGSLLLDPTWLYLIHSTSSTGDQDANISDDELLFAAPDTTDDTVSDYALNALGNVNITLQAKNTIYIGGSPSSLGAAPTVAEAISIPNLTSATLTLTAGNTTTSGGGNIIFYTGSSITTGGGALTLNVGDPTTEKTGNATLGAITTDGGALDVIAQQSVTLNGAINTGAGTVTIETNQSAGSGNSFTMNSGGSITTTNTSSSAVVVDVNTASGGNGTAVLGDITTGIGGTISVLTNFGSNTTGGSITQTASTLLDSGATGTLTLSTGAAAAGIGTNGANILSEIGNFDASSGSSGIYINDTDTLTLTGITTSGNGVFSATVPASGNPSILQSAGSISTGSGNITLTVPTTSTGTIGTSGSHLATTTTGSIILTSGSGGAYIANTGSFTLGTTTLATNNPLFVSSSGTLTLAAGAMNTGTGSLTLESLGGALVTTANLGTSTGGILLSASTNLTIGSSFSVSASGAGDITLDANTGAGSGNAFTMNSGSSISTASTDSTAVVINVNSGSGGNGTAALGNITTGNGGTIKVDTNFGSNTTGGSITQAAGTLLNSGATGSLTLSTGAAAAGIGTSGANILSEIGNFNASAGSAGIFINDTDTLTLTGITTSGNGVFTATVPASGNPSILQSAGSISTGSGTITLTVPTTSTGSIGTSVSHLATTTTGSITLTSGSGGAYIANTGSLTLTTPTLATNNPLFVSSSSTLTLPASTISTGTGSLTLESLGGALTTTGNLSTTTGTISLSASTNLTIGTSFSVSSSSTGDITLDANTGAGSGNAFTMNTGSSISTASTDATAVVIDVNGASGGNGTAALSNITTGAGGTITVATNTGSNTTGGSITQTAATLLNSGSSGTVSLATGAAAAGVGTSAANILTETRTLAVSTGSAGANVTNNLATVLGAITTTGPLTLTSNGSITQSGALVMSGTPSFNITVASSDILLTNTSNNFSGTIAFLGTESDIRDLDIYNTSSSAVLPATLLPLTGLRNVTFDFTNTGMELPEETLHTAGDLTVTADGNITQAGQQLVPGTTSISNTNLSSGQNGITLNLANNIFTGTVALTNCVSGSCGSGNVALTDNAPLEFTNVAVGTGTLTILSTQAITQQASTSIMQASGAGLASLTSLGGLTLTNSGNSLVDVTIDNLVNGNIQLTNTASTLTVTGVTAAGGGNITIINTGNILSNGSITNTPNGVITLTASGTETISSPITSNGSGNINLTGGSGIDLGANLTTSGGNVIFNDAVTLTGNVTVNSSIGNIDFVSTLNGDYSPTFTSTGTLTFGSVVGNLMPLAALTITANSPGTTVVDGNISTVGSQSYGNPVTLNTASEFLATNGSASITITGGVSWSGSTTFEINAPSIIINGGISGTNGTFELSAAAPPTESITTGAGGSVSVKNFNLLQGFWYQDGTLPNFSVSNDFEINSGTIPASTVEFLRVSGGSGSSGSKYQITDIYGLQGIESNTSLLSDYYIVTGGITASTANWNGGIGFIPIGTASNQFTGNFNGQGNSISGVTIDSSLSSNIGLFGDISGAATVSNVELSGVSVTSSANSATDVGALVGQNNGTMQSDSSTGSVSASGSSASNIGGLVGDNLGSLTESYSTASVSASASSSSDIGGLVGKNESANGTLQQDYSWGAVSAGSGSSDIGGLVGLDSSTNSNAILNTYSISSITVSSGVDVGGLVGNQATGSGPITTSYASGSVPASGTDVGGFIGLTNTTNNNSNYFDSTSSGTGTGVGSGSINGVLAGCFAGGSCTNGGSADLSSVTTFNSGNNTNWSITAGPGSGSTPAATTWYIISGSTRPMLAIEWSTSVTNAHQLELMNMALGASYSLANNIDLTVASPSGNASDVWGGSANSTGFYPIGNTSSNFKGSLNGNSNSISNLYINSSSSTGVGLFGATSNAVSISSLSVTSVNITNSSSDIGAVVGSNAGTLTNVSSSGTIDATGSSVSDIGGLVGENTGTITANTNTFSSSSVNITVSGNDVSNIGDFVGQSTDAIANSFSKGTLTISGNSETSIGGLIGDNQGSVNTVTSSSPINLSGTSDSDIGGLVGTNETADGYITIAYSTGTISSTHTATTTSNVGGLVGYEDSTYSTTQPILNTYSTSNIDITSNGTDVAGLVGDQASGAIANSYSIGSSTVSGTNTDVAGFIGAMGSDITNADNFYDTTTSNTSTSVGSVGGGSTTGVTQGCFSGTCPKGGSAILSEEATFTTADWDFTTVPIWGIFDGVTYPYFTGLTLGVEVIDAITSSTPTAATGGNILTPALEVTSGNDYDYLFNKSDLSTNPILFYNTTGTVGNGLVEPPTGIYSAPITITITADTIQVGGSNTGTISSNNFGSSMSGGANVLFSSGGTLTIGNSTYPNITLQTASTTTFNINGSINSYGSNDVMIVNGPTTINNGGSSITTSGNQTYNDNVTLSSAVTFADTNTGATITFASTAPINTGGNSSDIITLNNVDANSVVNSVISGSGGITMEGTGTFTLANNNLYSGATTLENGMLELNVSGASPTPLGSGGTLYFSGGTLTAGSSLTGPVANDYQTTGIAAISTIGGANNLTLSGTGSIGTGYILNVTNSATTTLSGALSGNGAITEESGTLEVGGTASDPSTANNSSYAGTITLNNGGLEISAATNALGTGTTVLNNGTVSTTIASPTTTVLGNPVIVYGDITVSGTNSLIEFNGATTLYGGNLTVTNTGTTTLSGTLEAGAGSLTVDTSGGTVVVSNSATTCTVSSNCSYLGATTITMGTLDIDAPIDGLGTGTGNSLILNGGLLQSTYSGGTAVLVNKFLVGGSGSATIGGINNLTLNGNGTLNNILNVTNTADTITLNGVIIGTAGSIVQDGTGGVLAITGTNTFGTAGTTGVTVTAGTLSAQNSKALGIGNGVVSSGGQLDIDGSAFTVTNPLNIAGSGVSGAGALVDVGSGGNIESGLITLGGSATIGNTSASETLTLSGGMSIPNVAYTASFEPSVSSGIISETGIITGSGGLAMPSSTAPGTLELSGTNTFTGNNSFSDGEVIVSNNQGLGVSNTTTINSSALVQDSGADLVSTEAFTLNGGTLQGTKNSTQPTENGAITLTANSSDTISTVTSADTFTLDGTMNGTSGGSNNGDLTLSGSGTITIGAAIGATTNIDSLTDSSTTNLGANITSVNSQTYSGTVTPSTNTTLKTTGSGNINIQSTIADSSHTLTLTSGGDINESGSGKITAATGTVTASSQTGTTLNGANTIKTFGSTDASVTGTTLTNTAAPLTLDAITESDGGSISITNTGGITIGGGNLNTTGTVSLSSTGVIQETGSDDILNASSLTTTSSGGTTLSNGNTVTALSATNTSSGNITVSNTIGNLGITKISQSGGGTTSVTNTGGMTVTSSGSGGSGVTGGAGSVTLSATGALAVNDGVSTTNQLISLTGAGVTVAASTNVSSGSGNITVDTTGAGNTLTLNSLSDLLSTGTVNLSADLMVFDTSASPAQVGSTGSDVILQPTTSGRAIYVAGSGSPGLQLSIAELADVDATKVRIGNSTAGALMIVNAWTPVSTFATNGILTLDSGSTITQTGALDLVTNSNAGLLLRDASSVTLTSSSNDLSNIASSNISGTLQLEANSALTIASLTDDESTVNGISATGGVTINALLNAITLNSGTTVTADASGYDIVLAGDMFTNMAGSGALVTGGADNYFQVWSGTPVDDNRGGLVYAFKQYDATYGVTSPAQATGDGFLYTFAPVITPILIGTVTKQYDGTTTATLTASNYSSTDIIDGDTITYNNPTSGTYDTADTAGSPTKTITVTGLTIVSETNASANVYGYQLSSTTATGNIGTITAQPLTITGVVANNKVYDTTEAATLSNNGSITDIPNGITLNTSSLTATFVSPNVNNPADPSPITVNVTGYSLSGTNNYDYTLNPVSTTAIITPYPLTVSGLAANNKVYDGTTTATLNTTSATLNGIFASDTGNVYFSTVGVNGGTGTFASQNFSNGLGDAVTVTTLPIAGSAAGNYSIPVYPTGLSANITPATLTYTANTASMTYGGSVPGLSGNVTGFVTGENLSNATTGSATFTTSANGMTDVGTYAIDGSGLTANNGNYVFVQAGSNATALIIGPATLTYNATPTSIYYGGTVPTLTGNVTGFQNSDNISNATTGTLNFSTLATGANNVGTYAITGSGLTADNGNYVFVQASANSTAFTINPATLTYNATPASMTYGGSVPSVTGTITGFVNSQNQGTATTGSLTFSTSVTALTNVGNYAIDGSGLTANNGNYVFVQNANNATAMTINPATLTYNANTATMTYGGSVPSLSGTVTGFVNSQNLGNATTGSTSFTTLAGPTNNVGTYAITGSGLTANNGNYVFVQASGNATALTINPATLTYNATPASIIYGGTVPTLAGTVSGFVNSDTLNNATTGTLNFSTLATGASNVGTYAITGSGLTANNGNYVFVQASANSTAFTINPATLTYNATPASMTYGGSVPSVTGTITGFVNSQNQGTATTGSLTFSTSVTALTNVGNYAIDGSGLTANNGNYVFVQNANNATAMTINPATLTYNANTATMTYGGSVPSLSGTVTGFVNSQNLGNATTGSASFTTLAGPTNNVGTYAITGSGLTANNGNYVFVQASGNATALTINPATLTYNATPASIIYGGTVPTLAGTVSGFVNSDTLNNATTGTLNFSTLATGASNVGTYAITGSGLTANNGNYVFVQASANSTAFTINPATLTYNATPASMTYGGSVPSVTGTITGFVNSQNQGTATTGSLTFSTSVTALTNVGNYAIDGSGLTANNGNYVFVQNANNATAMTINPATLTYNASPTVMVYGTAVPTLTGNVTGFVNSQSLTGATTGTLMFSTNATSTSPVGGYQSNGSGLTANFGNYVFVQASGNATALTIDPATLTVALIGTTSKVYDTTTVASLAANNYQLTGIVGSDNVVLNDPTTGVYASPNVNTNINVSVSGLQISGTAATNYVLQSTSANGNIGIITPAPLTIQDVVANNKVYNGNTTATLNSNNAILVGVYPSDDSNVNLSTSSATANFTSINVGTNIPVNATGYAITGSEASNYSVSQPTNLSANITPATLTITNVIANNKNYDGNTVTTLNLGGSALQGIVPGDSVSVSQSGYSANFVTPNVGNNISVTVLNIGIFGPSSGNYILLQPIGIFADILSNSTTVPYQTVNPTNLFQSNTNNLFSFNFQITPTDISLDVPSVHTSQCRRVSQNPDIFVCVNTGNN